MEQNPVDAAFVRKVDAWLCGQQGFGVRVLSVKVEDVIGDRFVRKLDESGAIEHASDDVGARAGDVAAKSRIGFVG